MTDPNNQNFFDPTAPSENPVTPWWKRPRNLAWGGGVLGLLLVIGFVAAYVYQSTSLRPDSDKSRLEEAEQLVELTAADCEDEEDVEACQARARSDAAVETGEEEVCAALSGQQLKNCVVLIARDEADPDVCDVLEGEDQISCQDSAYLVQAKEQGRRDLCENIQNDTKRASCEGQLGADDESDVDEAVASGNPQNCAQLSADDKAECEDAYTSIDSDGDGLSRFEEYRLGTSDDESDTDGDGYDDAMEVESGHNPLS